MNIKRTSKRLLVVGCSHGGLADPLAIDAVLRFKLEWKPQIVIHLGDWCDTAALRLGARDNADEAEPIRPDIDDGLFFLEQLGVTHCLMGNHDERPYRYLKDPRAMVRELAQMLVDGIETRMRKLRIYWLNSWSVFDHLKIGGVKYLHGTVYTENAARDHAEMHGRCVFAHTHTTMLQKGRRDDNPTGICVGTLAGIANMDYAKTRRKTLSWSQGFAWGECTENDTQLWLHENGQNRERLPWRLPI